MLSSKSFTVLTFTLSSLAILRNFCVLREGANLSLLRVDFQDYLLKSIARSSPVQLCSFLMPETAPADGGPFLMICVSSRIANSHSGPLCSCPGTGELCLFLSRFVLFLFVLLCHQTICCQALSSDISVTETCPFILFQWVTQLRATLNRNYL